MVPSAETEDAVDAPAVTPAGVSAEAGRAMENLYEANYPPQPGGGMVGLIHMGARYTSVTLLENGYSMFTGDLTVGGEEFTETLRKELNVSNEAAEAAKINRLASTARRNLNSKPC